MKTRPFRLNQAGLVHLFYPFLAALVVAAIAGAGFYVYRQNSSEAGVATPTRSTKVLEPSLRHEADTQHIDKLLKDITLKNDRKQKAAQAATKLKYVGAATGILVDQALNNAGGSGLPSVIVNVWGVDPTGRRFVKLNNVNVALRAVGQDSCGKSLKKQYKRSSGPTRGGQIIFNNCSVNRGGYRVEASNLPIEYVPNMNHAGRQARTVIYTDKYGNFNVDLVFPNASELIVKPATFRIGLLDFQNKIAGGPSLAFIIKEADLASDGRTPTDTAQQTASQPQPQKNSAQECKKLLDGYFQADQFKQGYGLYGLTGGEVPEFPRYQPNLKIFDILNPFLVQAGNLSDLRKAAESISEDCEEKIDEALQLNVIIKRPKGTRQFKVELQGVKCAGGNTLTFAPFTNGQAFKGCTPGQISLLIKLSPNNRQVKEVPPKGYVVVTKVPSYGQTLLTLNLLVSIEAEKTQSSSESKGPGAAAVAPGAVAQNKKDKPKPKPPGTISASFAKGRCSRAATQAAYRKPADASKFKARGEHLNAQDKRNLLTACQFGYRDGYADAVAGRSFAPPCHRKFIVQPKVPGPNQEKACDVGYRSGADHGNCRKKGRSASQC